MTLREFHQVLGDYPGLRRCALIGYGGVACEPPLQGHHIIPKSALLGNEQALDYVEMAPFELLAPVCSAHNVGRYADEPLARALMIRQKVDTWGWWHMAEILEVLRALMKVDRPEWRLEAILAPLEG